MILLVKRGENFTTMMFAYRMADIREDDKEQDVHEPVPELHWQYTACMDNGETFVMYPKHGYGEWVFS
jgi:hypothetical protein